MSDETLWFEVNGVKITVPIKAYSDTTDSDNRKVTLKLSTKAIGLDDKSLNMQADKAAFEPWAFILHDGSYEQIILDTEDNSNLPQPALNQRPHYNRFLYRALRFSEQYDSWFSLSPRLQAAVDKFAQLLNSSRFVNNYPSTEAKLQAGGNNDNSEAKIERKFMSDKAGYLKQLCAEKSITIEGQIHSQLPVGLFKGSKEAANSLFAKSRAAIDLWNISGEEFNLFELKVQNKQKDADKPKAKTQLLGAITELFFYANYCHDLLIADNNWHAVLVDEGAKDVRGYRAIDAVASQKQQLKHINAVLLADKFHYLLTNIIDGLNQGKLKGVINYSLVTYDLNQLS